MTFPARAFCGPVIEALRGRAFLAQGNESVVTSDPEDCDTGLVKVVDGERSRHTRRTAAQRSRRMQDRCLESDVR